MGNTNGIKQDTKAADVVQAASSQIATLQMAGYKQYASLVHVSALMTRQPRAWEVEL